MGNFPPSETENFDGKDRKRRPVSRRLKSFSRGAFLDSARDWFEFFARPVRVGPPTGPVEVTGGRGSLALPRSLVRPLLLVLRNEAVGIEDGGVVLARVTPRGKGPASRPSRGELRPWSHRLRARLSAANRLLCRRALHRARHGQLRAQRTRSALPHFFEIDIRHVASRRSRRKDRFRTRKSRKQSPATASKWGGGAMFALKECKGSFHEHARVRLVVVFRSNRRQACRREHVTLGKIRFTSLGDRTGDE